jgi:hypothetical protein
VRTPPSESTNPRTGEFFTLYQMVEPMGVEPTASRVRFRSRAKPAIQQKPAVTIKAQVTERLFARFVHPSQHGSWASCVSVPAQFPQDTNESSTVPVLKLIEIVIVEAGFLSSKTARRSGYLV